MMADAFLIGGVALVTMPLYSLLAHTSQLSRSVYIHTLPGQMSFRQASRRAQRGAAEHGK